MRRPGRRPGAAVALVQYGLFVVLLGLPDGALGVMWPSMRRSFHRPLADLGVLVVAGTALYVLGSLRAGDWLVRLGAGRLVGLAAVGGTAVLAAWTAAPVWGVALGGVALLGLSRGVVDAGVNAYVAATPDGMRRLGGLHAAYGIGAMLGPVVVAPAVGAGAGWRPVPGTFTALGLLLCGLAWTRAAHWPAADLGEDDRGGRGGGPVPRRVVAGILVTFFVYVGTEAVPGLWGYVLLTDGQGFSSAVATAAVSAYWGGLALGRLTLGVVGERRPAEQVLGAGVVLALAGLLLVWADPLRLGPLGLPVAGLGMSVVFPMLVGLTPRRVGAAAAPRVIGWSVGTAAVGGPAAAGLAGAVTAGWGPAAVAPYAASLGVVLLALYALTQRRPV